MDDGEYIVALVTDQSSYAVTNKKNLVKFSGDDPAIKQQIVATNLGALCINSQGDIWTGTNKGVLVFDSRDLKVSATYTAASGLSDNFIADIFKDAEGNMWIGTPYNQSVI